MILKMKPFKHNNKNNFVAGWYINKKVCADMIKYFNVTNETNAGIKHQGTIGGPDGGFVIDKKVKHSTDLPINIQTQDDVPIRYLAELRKVVEEYKKKYPWSDTNHALWGMRESFNIQKYPKNGGFFKPHFERTGSIHFEHRHLVFMTYLNTIKTGGQTEFMQQKLKVNAEAGLTLIWPADWTFAHRGIRAPKEIKYIATGWYGYLHDLK